MNYREALERIGGDYPFLEELLNLYQEEFSAKFIRIQKSIDQENFRQIEELGHCLKGASAILSLGPLENAFFELEMAGRERDIEKAKKIPPLLDQEFEKLKDFLAKMRSTQVFEARIGE